MTTTIGKYMNETIIWANNGQNLVDIDAINPVIRVSGGGLFG